MQHFDHKTVPTVEKSCHFTKKAFMSEIPIKGTDTETYIYKHSPITIKMSNIWLMYMEFRVQTSCSISSSIITSDKYIDKCINT